MLLFVFARVPYIQFSLLKNNALLFIGNWSFAKYGEVKRNMEHESQKKSADSIQCYCSGAQGADWKHKPAL